MIPRDKDKPHRHGREMSVDAKLREHVERALGVIDDHGTHGPRLLDDAGRLWRRVEQFIAMHLVHEGVDREALELACYAMQLPGRRGKGAGKTAGKGAMRSTLRDRAEEAAELLVGIAGPDVDEHLLDRATRVLQEMPHRSPMLDEAKLLADAVNLEDFGAIGVIGHAIQLARAGEGVTQLAEGCDKREQYGYWDARLKDGFHFEAVRQIAIRRLSSTRQICAMLAAELKQDTP
jgi:hypothetical protein